MNKKINKPIGKCSVPMWDRGMPAGLCDRPAYGERLECPAFRDAWTGEIKRLDGKYAGWVSGFACPLHGGPEPEEEKEG